MADTTLRLKHIHGVSAEQDSDSESSDPARNYDIGRTLGTGAFAVVRAATRRDNSLHVAVKLIDKKRTSVDDAKRELQVLGAVGMHRNIVCLLDIFETPSEWALVLELVSGGEVFDRICERGPYSEADAADVARQIGRALLHMHSVGVW